MTAPDHMAPTIQKPLAFRAYPHMVHGSAPGPARGYGTVLVSRAVGIAWDVDTRDAASSSIPSSGTVSETGRCMRLGCEDEAT